MPTRPPRPCTTCGTITRNHPHCHPTTTARGYGWDWQKIRPHILRRDNHTCRIQLPGCTTVATTIDHITPLAAGGTHHPTNLQAACVHCNSTKAAQPTPRGQRISGAHINS